jgi:protein-L-isoaspartate(D-aspartate) O-methyltransferase
MIMAADDSQTEQRVRMVDEQIIARGVGNLRVLEAMRSVPRHEFVPQTWKAFAYDDRPLPIGEDQTISQPYIVALMTELAHLSGTSRVLEVGTGSGYQAAVLARITPDVYTIEIVRALHERALPLLKKYGLGEDRVILGDGYRGWPKAAPFDAIIVTAAPDHIPPALVEQLKPGGKMVVPVGPTGSVQRLLVIEKNADGSSSEKSTIPVQFVPLTGEAEKHKAGGK